VKVTQGAVHVLFCPAEGEGVAIPKSKAVIPEEAIRNPAFKKPVDARWSHSGMTFSFASCRKRLKSSINFI